MLQEIQIKKDIFIKKYDKVLEDDYFIQNKTIGSGAYGKVYIGFKKFPKGKPRAIKVIEKRLVRDKDMLRNEIEVMKQLDHPNILKLYEIYEYQDKYALIMELCEGHDLYDELIKRQHLTETEAKYLFIQMVQSLNYMHKKKMCHRDIKPENYIFLTKEKNSPLMLIDFGFAQKYESQEILHSKVGTCFYIAPEVLKGDYNEKCDIWSLGIILFVFIFGYHPFDGDSNQDIFDKIILNEFSHNCKNFNKKSQQIQSLLKGILNKDPKKRFTCQEILDHPWMKWKNENKIIRDQFKQITNFKNLKKLKQIALKCIASQLQIKEIEKYGTQFKNIDRNQDGFITKSDLMTSSFQKLDQQDSQNNKAQKYYNQSELNINIDFNTFVAQNLQKSLYLQEDKLRQAFESLDFQKKGCITATNLRNVFQSIVLKNQEKLIDDEIYGKLLKSSDLNHDGAIDFSEFKYLMQND